MKIKIRPIESVIILRVVIKGRVIEYGRMALDTGATYIMIPWKLANALGLKPEVSKKRIYITTASGVELVPLVNLKSVTVLGKTAKNVKAVVHDLPRGTNIDGLLGLSFMKNFNWFLDFKKGFLEIL
jgi:clan AA aspartic protease (TIGR02281 family)